MQRGVRKDGHTGGMRKKKSEQKEAEREGGETCWKRERVPLRAKGTRKSLCKSDGVQGVCEIGMHAGLRDRVLAGVPESPWLLVASGCCWRGYISTGGTLQSTYPFPQGLNVLTAPSALPIPTYSTQKYLGTCCLRPASPYSGSPTISKEPWEEGIDCKSTPLPRMIWSQLLALSVWGTVLYSTKNWLAYAIPCSGGPVDCFGRIPFGLCLPTSSGACAVGQTLPCFCLFLANTGGSHEEEEESASLSIASPYLHSTVHSTYSSCAVQCAQLLLNDVPARRSQAAQC